MILFWGISFFAAALGFEKSDVGFFSHAPFFLKSLELEDSRKVFVGCGWNAPERIADFTVRPWKYLEGP